MFSLSIYASAWSLGSKNAEAINRSAANLASSGFVNLTNSFAWLQATLLLWVQSDGKFKGTRLFPENPHGSVGGAPVRSRQA